MSNEHELSRELNTKMKDDFKYNYYEIYCEPTEIDWSDPDFDLADYDFSNDNFSLMLRVKKGQDKPNEQEVEDFLGDDYLLIDTEEGKKRYHVIGVWENERDDGGEVFDLGDFEYEDIITYPEVLTSSLEEDLELQPVDVFDDEKAEALTLYLDDEGTAAAIVREYPEESYGYRSNLYENLEDNAEWLICTRDEATTYVRDRIYDYISDVGPLEAYSWGFVENYLDDDYFNSLMEEEIRYQINDLGYDELAERLEDADLISEDDKIQDPDWEPDEDEPDEEPEMIYSEDLLDSKRDELADYEISCYSSGVDYFSDMYGDDYLEQQVNEDPEYAIDINRMVDDIVDDSYFGDELAEDGEEIELAIRDENDRVKDWLYAYKVS